MARVGGYALVDGSGIDEAQISTGGAEITVPGIFTKFHNALLTQKPVIVENVVNGDNVYNPFEVTIHGDNLKVTVSLGTIVVQIGADDKVTNLNAG